MRDVTTVKVEVSKKYMIIMRYNIGVKYQLKKLLSVVFLYCIYSTISAIPKIPEIVVKNSCAFDEIKFSLLNTVGVDSVVWNFDDMESGVYNTSRSMAPSHTFNFPKKYNVEARIYYRKNQLTVKKSVEIYAPYFKFPEMDDLCEGDVYNLKSPHEFKTYSWSSGASGSSITVDTEGEYSLLVTDDRGCWWKDSVLINYIHEPVLNDTLMCVGDTISLAVSDEFSSYQWSTGSEMSETKIYAPGEYTLSLKAAGDCDFKVSFYVDELPQPKILTVNRDVGGVIIVEDIDGTPPFSFSINGDRYQNTQVFTGLLPGDYFINVKDNTGCVGGFNTSLELKPVVSDYFSPNNDLVKDYVYVQGLEHIADCSMKIYNRFGCLLANYNPNDFHWDGMFNNSVLPSDTYWYLLSFVQNGVEHNKTGKIALIR